MFSNSFRSPEFQFSFQNKLFSLYLHNLTSNDTMDFSRNWLIFLQTWDFYFFQFWGEEKPSANSNHMIRDWLFMVGKIEELKSNTLWIIPTCWFNSCINSLKFQKVQIMITNGNSYIPLRFRSDKRHIRKYIAIDLMYTIEAKRDNQSFNNISLLSVRSHQVWAALVSV